MVVGLQLAAVHCCRPQAELVLQYSVLHLVLALADPRPHREQKARHGLTSGVLMPKSVLKYRLRLKKKRSKASTILYFNFCFIIMN